MIGAGGLGSSVLPLLARAGLPIALLDDDEVSLSNLQRQLLYRTSDVGRPKATAAAERIAELVPGCSVRPIRERLTPENALAYVADAALVVDGSDNFSTRFLANDACVLGGKPLVHGGILRFTGQVLTVLPRTGACYRCLFETPPPAGSVPSCAEAGVLGALCGVVGAWMAEAAIGIATGTSPSLLPGGDGLLVYDALHASVRPVRLRRDPRCLVCGDEPTIRTLDPALYAPEACAA